MQGRDELRVSIRPAGPCKGMGAFAEEAAAPGTWVCEYEGALVTKADVATRYGGEEPAYLFRIGDDLFLDGQDSEHFSRYINHAEAANLGIAVSLEQRRVDLVAATPISPGDELCFDYGPDYWAAMPFDPTPESDSRRYGRRRWLRRQRKLLAHTAPAAFGSLLLPVLIPLCATLWSTQ